jgi:aminopeptidase-like protein
MIIPGKSKKEVFLSTYICHPSMANNELSGPVVTTFLAKWLNERKENKYTYRIIFIPETIGSIVYISKNLKKMKENIFAGFNVSCVGDDRSYSYLPSRNGNTISDAVAKHVLKHLSSSFISYEWKDRGSDERQYCAPHVDLPIASIMRTKYGEYSEYHTSLDTLGTVVTDQGLSGGFNALRSAIEVLENNIYPTVQVKCEPQLGKRGLYPNLSTKDVKEEVGLMMDLITWSDGSRSLLEIAEICHVPMWELYPLLELMVSNDLISVADFN